MVRKLRNIELNRLSVDEFKATAKSPLVVVLDGVRSMSNVGSIFRTCDAFNVAHLYLTGISPQPPHREITKTAIGAELAVDWSYEKSIMNVIRDLRDRDYQIIAVEQTSESTLLSDWEPDADGKIAIVFGHEIDGVSDEVISLSDACIEIPQFGTKHSLNVSVCAGVVLWQAGLNRLKGKRE